MDEQIIRNEIYKEILSQNRYLTESYLNLLSTKAVIGLTHPLYRDSWRGIIDRVN